jgi:hypothetical protein
MWTKARSLSQATWQAIRKPLGGISLSILLAIIIAENVAPTAFHQLTETHSITFSLLSGFVVLAFTLSVIDAVVENQASQHWRQIRGVTLKGLNDELRTARDILYLTIIGQPPYGTARTPLREAVGLAQLSRVKWQSEVAKLNQRQLGGLVENGDWADFATLTLRIATEQLRAGIAQWVPLTALAKVDDDDQEVLSQVALMADVLEALEFPLGRRQRDDSNAVKAAYREQFCQLWSSSIVGFIYVEEEIVRTLDPVRPEPWRSQARKLLADDLEGHLNDWQSKKIPFRDELEGLHTDLRERVEQREGSI